MAPFGSVIAKAASDEPVTLRTADNILFEVSPRSMARWAIRLLGVPHIGLRMRARLLVERAREALDRPGSRPLLDLGCGIGFYSIELGSRIDRPVVGMDLEFEKVQTAARMSRTLGLASNFVVGDAERLPFKGDAFDAVLCSEVLEHVPGDGKAIAEINRALHPGGSLFLSTTAVSDITEAVEDDMGHARAGYTRADLSSLVEKSGLRVKEILPYGMMFGAAAWTMNRKSFGSRALLGLTFVPLLLLSRLDGLLRRGSYDEHRIIGWIVAAQK